MKSKMAFCEACSYKKIVKQEDLENAVSMTEIPGGVPKLDPETKKTVSSPSLKRSPMIKCPNCGRGIVIKDLPGAYSKTIKQLEEKKQELETKQAREQRILDGTPIKRQPEFLDPPADPEFKA